MNQYIDKTAVVKVIENRIREIQELLEKNEKKLDSIQKTAALLCMDELIMILSLIDTLKVRKANSEFLKKHFEETPQKELDKEWKEIESLNDIGPDVLEYANKINETKKKNRTMIKERYCSYEVARLLKEKGFDEECHHIYVGVTLVWTNTIYGKDAMSDNEIPDADTDVITAPTHQMAMEWLREKYKIAINIRITCEKTISYAFDIWDFEIIHPNKFVGGTIDLREQQFSFKSYEDAVEAALKYVLENLI